jgi:hypothetical protein
MCHFLCLNRVKKSYKFGPVVGLGPKSLRGNRIYKGHKDIENKASHCFEKASIPLKIYLKYLAILEKASTYLKKSLKIIEIFIKVPHF